MEGQHVMGKQPRELDQFFTKPDIAQMCVAHLNRVFPISEFKSIIEPAHGNMAFVNALVEWKDVVVSMDIDAVDESKRKDFLTHTHTHTHTHWLWGILLLVVVRVWQFHFLTMLQNLLK
jgi:hypothetical protein